jgi:adenosylmethionine-8-amino-7-oxononanoate aminotransferase
MTRILQRNPAIALPEAVRGEGVHLYDAAGREYIDASGGAAVSSLGHGHADVLGAMRAQMERIAYAHTSFFTTRVAEELAERLVAGAPPGMSHAYFVSGGSEAVEAALKMARQYHVDRGEPGRTQFVSRRQSYHGNTLGALAVSGRLANRASFEPILVGTTRVSPCYEYRERRQDETPEAYGARLATELDDAIEAIGAGRVIAFIAETVSGATLGACPPVPGYLRGVREVCDKHGVLLILDEVMCGMGRTGTLHACEQEGVVADLMTLAKGLGGGYQPIGAVLVNERVVRAFERGSGAFQHGHTYLAHPMAAAAALAVQEVIVRDGLLARVRERGASFAERLRHEFAEHPHVGDVRGRGLFRAVELVADRATKQPFDPALKLHARVKREAMARGLCCYPSGGAVDGRAGDHVLLAPPFIVQESDLERIVARLRAAIDAAIADSAPGT